MKNRLLICAIFTIALFAAAETRVSAQTDQIAGGYGDLSVKSKDARNFAAFAVRTRSSVTGKKITLLKILKAEQQVVAGMNYRICMRVREYGRRPFTVTAVVYKNLQNKRSLSKWKKGQCADI